MNNKKIALIVGSLLLLGGFFWLASRYYKAGEVAKYSFMASENAATFVPDHAITMGTDQAKVYLVEFFDPECEACREFHPFVKLLMKDYEGKIKLVMRYAPFHGNSVMVVKILEAARKQGKYWEALDTLYQHQPEWGSHHHPRPDLIWTYLPQSGVDVEQIRKDMNDPAFEKIIEQDRADGQKLGVTRTPTFFINGKPLQEFGPGPLRAAIEAELAAP